MALLQFALNTGNTETILFALVQIAPIYIGMKRNILKEIQTAVVTLSSLKQPSVLRAICTISALAECKLPELCIEEMYTR